MDTPTERSEAEDVRGSGVSTSSSDEFDFYPLLSPPNVEEEVEKDDSAPQWPLPPLFLKLVCSINNEERGGSPRETTTEGLPLCLSKQLRDYM